ncbi:hypothetical protein AAG570_007396 [Ranatra chinensis]|uniref:Uncharacterized protein n=1 Tax=Ranatra chinensis TaxID=642074 RepID=A0ABD0XVR6_9HEMI
MDPFFLPDGEEIHPASTTFLASVSLFLNDAQQTVSMPDYHTMGPESDSLRGYHEANVFLVGAEGFEFFVKDRRDIIEVGVEECGLRRTKGGSKRTEDFRLAIRRAEETEGDATERDRKTVDMTEFNQLNSMTQWLLGGCGAERVQGEAIRCPPQSAEHVLQVASRYRHGRGLKTVLDSRRPPTDRAQLAAFYKYLLQKIVEEMTEMETGRVKPPCAMDPLVMRMMLRLRVRPSRCLTSGESFPLMPRGKRRLLRPTE